MKDVDKQLVKDINACLDEQVFIHQHVIEQVKKVKKELTSKSNDVSWIVKLFADNGVEICGYDLSAFRAPIEDDNQRHVDKEGNFVYYVDKSNLQDNLVYSTIVFHVKHPDNDVIINVIADYVITEDVYYLKNKTKKESTSKGYEMFFCLYRKNDSRKETVNKNSGKLNMVRNCVYSIQNKARASRTTPYITKDSDKTDIECFFHILHALLSLKTTDDAKKFKEGTIPAIISNLDMLNSVDHAFEQEYECHHRFTKSR